MSKTNEAGLRQTKLILHTIVSVLAILALGGITFWLYTTGSNWAWIAGAAAVGVFWELMDELR